MEDEFWVAVVVAVGVAVLVLVSVAATGDGLLGVGAVMPIGVGLPVVQALTKSAATTIHDTRDAHAP